MNMCLQHQAYHVEEKLGRTGIWEQERSEEGRCDLGCASQSCFFFLSSIPSSFTFSRFTCLVLCIVCRYGVLVLSRFGPFLRCHAYCVQCTSEMTTKKQQPLPLCDRVEIRRLIEHGENKKDVASHFGIARSTLSMILKNKAGIRANAWK